LRGIRQRSPGHADFAIRYLRLDILRITRIIGGMISTATALIDALGGNQVVAELLGVQHNTVSTWRVRGFPAWACGRLRAAADAGEHRYAPELFEIRPPQNMRPAAAETQAA
jgi:hypothetical protein